MIRFLCFLYSSSLLIEPVRLYVLKREFLLFIALSNIGESQGRCFLGGSHFLGIQMSITSRNFLCHNDQSTFTLVAFEIIECQSVASNRSHANSKLA